MTAPSSPLGKLTPAEKRELVGGFLLATLVYTTGYVVRWAQRRAGLRSWWSDVVIVALMWLTFVGVTGRLAILGSESNERTAPLVSSAAVLAAGLIRTALAAAGTWEFLQWDHDNVIVEAVIEELVFALLTLVPAFLVAVCARLIFRRSR